MTDEEKALWLAVSVSEDWEAKFKPALELWIARQSRALAAEKDVDEIRTRQGGILAMEIILRLPDAIREAEAEPEVEEQQHGRRRVREPGTPLWGRRWGRKQPAE